MALIHSITFIFALYRLQDKETVIFDRIREKIGNILTQFPSVSLHICSDLNIHHKAGIVNFNKTDVEGRYYRDFSVAYELTMIIGEATCVLDATRDQAKPLDFFLSFRSDSKSFTSTRQVK